MAEQKRLGRPATRNPVRFNLSITEDAKEKLEKLAQTKRRPMNYVICSILDQALNTKESGTVSPTPQDNEPKAKHPRTGGHISEGATALLTISLQPELKAAVKAVAKMESRTASNMACLMLREWIETWEASHPSINIWADTEEE